MALQIRRGTDTERLAAVFAIGELVFTVDTKKVYIGDGTTLGGVELIGIDKLSDIGDVTLANYAQTPVSLVSCTILGNLTITTLSAHGLAAGQSVLVQLDGNTLLNGVFEVTGTPDAFTVILDGPLANVGETSDSGYIQRQGSDLADSSILVYSSATDTWVGGSLDLDSLLDVDLSGATLADNDRLAYDTATSTWKVVTGELSALNDVAITSASVNDILVYTGSEFENKQHTVDQIADTDLRDLAHDDGFVYDAASATWRPRQVIKASEPGITADFFLGNDGDGLDTPVSTAKMYVTYPNTSEARWGTGSAYFESRSKLVWANNLILGTQNFTLQFWMKTSDQGYGTNVPSRQIISSIDVDESILDNFLVTRRMIYANYIPSGEPSQTAGSITLWTQVDNGNGYIIGSGTAVIDDNQWHLITIQREAPDTFAIFVDGVLQRRRVLAGAPISFANHGGWNIGGRYFDDLNVNTRNYLGYLDEVQLYVGTALYSGLDEFTVPWWPSLGQSGYVGDSITRLGDVDTTSVTPTTGNALIWNGTNWAPGSSGASGRGDAGDFDSGEVDALFTFGVRGGGDFDTGTDDVPWEEVEIIVDAGDFG